MSIPSQPDHTSHSRDAEVDPADLDLDAWIAGIPTERRVPLHRPNPELEAQLEELERQIDELPEDEDEDAERGITDASAGVLAHRLEALRAARARDKITVRVREMDTEEIEAARAAGREAGVAEDDNEMLGFWVVSAATVEPHFTAAQLKALSLKGRTGSIMISDLIKATIQQWDLPSVPTSPGSSTSPSGPAGSGS